MGRSRSRSRGRRREKEDKPADGKRSRSEESAERSREREKRRRKKQRGFMQQQSNKGSSKGGMNPSTRAGMFWDGFQWIPSESSTNNAAAAAQRKLKRLYIGNVPVGCSEELFKISLIEKMRESEIIPPDRESQSMQLLIWLHQEHQYGFVELESVEMAEKVLARLDGMLVNGNPVQIKRPNDSSVAARNIPGVAPGAVAGAPLAIAAPPVCTSRIVQISDALQYDPYSTVHEDFIDTVEDMVEGCSQHGKINAANTRIIKQEHLQLLLDAALADHVQIGHVFLEFLSMGDASQVMMKMQNRKYDGRFLRYQSFPEDKFYAHIVPLSPPQ
ncbi:unnamed protein product [Amoebophrya sp. A25]|nr:unnamed protein product [Amoebophrya sp. A25]|eukprot:GSA25T00006414001.1